MKNIRTDYHIHPDYSLDADPVKIKDYCQRALELGLREICFTTHLDFDSFLDKKNKPSTHNWDWLDSYFNEISQAQSEFRNDDLQVKAGIEVGYLREFEKDIEKIISQYPFDFVLGAIHLLDGICIASRKESPLYFKNRSLSIFRRDYFTMLEELVKSGLFDCVAHLDIYQRYGSKFFGEEIATIHQGVIEPIFREMARRNMGLEINTSSISRGLKEFHPTREILSTAAKEGVTIFTVGSDAHKLDELGNHIDAALALLNDLKLSNHVYTRRKATPLA